MRLSAARLSQLKLGVRLRATSKYGNQIQMVDGHRLDSCLEARRYQELKLLLITGAIQDLEVHKPYPLHVGTTEIGCYEADFSYLENGKPVVEDCKGFITPLYRWKKKHLFAEHGIRIREIKTTR